MRRYLPLLCLLVAATPLAAAQVLRIDSFLMKAGDDPSWSRPDLDETGWKRVRFPEVPQPDPILWLRAEVSLDGGQVVEGKPLGLVIGALASHEIWWDGIRIGSGGVVGAEPEQEEPGPIQTHYAIPDRLTAPGPHLLAIRTSAFHRHFRPSTGYWYVLVGEYDRMISVGRPHTGIALTSLGGIVMMALLAALLFLLDRRDLASLLLGLLCLAAALLLVAESWRSLFGYSYDRHLLRLILIAGLSWAFDVLLLLFLARRFPMSGARWLVVAGLVGATLPLFVSHAWDPKAYWGFRLVFLLSAAWCWRATWRRQRGSVLAAIGVTPCLVMVALHPGRFLDRDLYLCFSFLLACLLVSHAFRVQRVRAEREAAQLKSARLEIELLRKHIQPHFLMNTLTALSEWIEQEPQVAVQMIQSLSEEFRVLADVSHRRLIRMEDEIRLCRTHLEIMSRRKKKHYSLATHGVDPDADIPPAVIHTLVENAITHGGHAHPQIRLRLTESSVRGRRRYTFRSPLGPAASVEPGEEGTGLRYIRARLQESFGDDWALSSRPEGSDWLTEILVPGKA